MAMNDELTGMIRRMQALRAEQPAEPFVTVQGGLDRDVVQHVVERRCSPEQRAQVDAVLVPASGAVIRGVTLEPDLEKSGEGLVERKVTVHRQGRTFQRRQKVRAGGDVPSGGSVLAQVEGGTEMSGLNDRQRNRLMAELEPTIRSAVSSVLASRQHSKADRDDLAQQGRLRAFTALDKYKPNAGSLRNYVRTVVRREVAKQAGGGGQGPTLAVPSDHHRKMMRRVKATEGRLETELGRKPTDREIFDDMQFSQADLGLGSNKTALSPDDTVGGGGKRVQGGVSWVKQFREGADRAANVGSLDAAVGGDDEGGQTALVEQIRGKTPGPHALVAEKQKLAQMREGFREVMGDMKPREREAVEMQFGLTGQAPMMRGEVADALAEKHEITRDEALHLVDRGTSNFRHRVKTSPKLRSLAKVWDMGAAKKSLAKGHTQSGQSPLVVPVIAARTS